ncbi:hypothetical protein [Lactobacillus sp. UCMA15818]|uniref:hypothetical protein n=1 Tax=Lactobacillus sp. UCMA15818 TaxID=2583394 RepID=UPI0025AF2FCD|nr:hypothetical protein [Lactobacillus sp. UCMA15818]
MVESLDAWNHVSNRNSWCVVGIQNVNWIHGKTVHLAESRQDYLAEIDNYLSKKSNE